MAKRKQINEETFNKIRSLSDYGLTQKQVADIIGCSVITVHRIKKSEAENYGAWRAEVKARTQAQYEKALESQGAPDTEVPYDVEIPAVTVEQNDTADAIRELTSVMRELVEAWVGRPEAPVKKRGLFK